MIQVESRVVKNDYTLRLKGQIYRIAWEGLQQDSEGHGLRMEQRRDGTIAIRFCNRCVAVSRCELKPPPTCSATDPETNKKEDPAENHTGSEADLGGIRLAS